MLRQGSRYLAGLRLTPHASVSSRGIAGQAQPVEESAPAQQTVCSFTAAFGHDDSAELSLADSRNDINAMHHVRPLGIEMI